MLSQWNKKHKGKFQFPSFLLSFAFGKFEGGGKKVVKNQFQFWELKNEAPIKATFATINGFIKCGEISYQQRNWCCRGLASIKFIRRDCELRIRPTDFFFQFNFHRWYWKNYFNSNSNELFVHFNNLFIFFHLNENRWFGVTNACKISNKNSSRRFWVVFSFFFFQRIFCPLPARCFYWNIISPENFFPWEEKKKITLWKTDSRCKAGEKWKATKDSRNLCKFFITTEDDYCFLSCQESGSRFTVVSHLVKSSRFLGVWSNIKGLLSRWLNGWLVYGNNV